MPIHVPVHTTVCNYRRIAIIRYVSYIGMCLILEWSLTRKTQCPMAEIFSELEGRVCLINEIYSNQLLQLCLIGEIAVKTLYFLANNSREQLMGTWESIE